LFAVIFALGAPMASSEGRLVVILVGAISIFLLGFTVFFWRGPTKFALRAQYLYGA